MSTEEEARAAAYRATQQRYERLRLERETALAGSPAERAALEDDWAPLLPDTGFDPLVLVRDKDDRAGGGTVVS